MATSTGNGPRPGCGAAAGRGGKADGAVAPAPPAGGVRGGNAEGGSGFTGPAFAGSGLAGSLFAMSGRGVGAADVVAAAGVVDAAWVMVRPDVGMLAGGVGGADVLAAPGGGLAEAGEAPDNGVVGGGAGLAEADGDVLPPAGTCAGDAVLDVGGMIADEPPAWTPLDAAPAGLPEIAPLDAGAPDTGPPEPGRAEGGAAAPDDPGGFPPLAEEPELGGGGFGVMGAGPTARLDLDV